MNYWDTCEDQWVLGLFCRHGHHHKECAFYTKSQTDKALFVRESDEEIKSNERLYLEAPKKT